MSLGARIRQLCQQRGWSQTQLSKKLNVYNNGPLQTEHHHDRFD
jgi:transcriptional regulator with XRE-family HTH domain